jgi:putative transposase
MEPGKTYHIYNHGNASDNLFRSDENYRYFISQFGKYVKPIGNTYAYCLMPNHFHFLLRIKEQPALATLNGFENLSGLALEEKVVQQFSNFFNGYTRAFNKMYDRRGKLFLLPFQRKPITNQWHFLNTWKYIHYNAVHHGFVKDIFDWPFSSVHDYRLKKIDPIILLEAKRLSESELNQGLSQEFIPNWNDFLEMEY